MLRSRPAWLHALPVDPGFHRLPRSSESARRAQFAAVDFVDAPDAGQIVATPHAGAGSSRSGQAESRWRRVLLGAPLAEAPSRTNGCANRFPTGARRAAGVLCRRMHIQRADLTADAVVVPEIIVKHRLHRPLHNGTLTDCDMTRVPRRRRTTRIPCGRSRPSADHAAEPPREPRRRCARCRARRRRA